jgi:hypothetical protein
MVQGVQTVQTVEAPSFILPRALRYGGFAAYSGQPAIPSSAKHASRDAGEEPGGELIGAQRLNVSNELNVFS